MDKLFIAIQYVLPQYLLSALMHGLTRIRLRAFKNVFIRTFIWLFRVDMNDAEQPDPLQFEHFNAFFTRALKPDARPIDPLAHGIICPVDGTVSQAGVIQGDKVFQAKGKSYNLNTLLGSEDAASAFIGGHFTTIYLSPRDYHRIHFPLSAQLKQMVHIPGQLFSVNPVTTQNIDGLFAQNERVCALFDTDAGPMAMILVGAIFVSSIETVWHGVVTPPRYSQIRDWQYDPKAAGHQFQKGDELGRFNMGSTIIMLFGKNRINWTENLMAERKVRLGQLIGRFQQL